MKNPHTSQPQTLSLLCLQSLRQQRFRSCRRPNRTPRNEFPAGEKLLISYDISLLTVMIAFRASFHAPRTFTSPPGAAAPGSLIESPPLALRCLWGQTKTLETLIMGCHRYNYPPYRDGYQPLANLSLSCVIIWTQPAGSGERRAAGRGFAGDALLLRL